MKFCFPLACLVAPIFLCAQQPPPPAPKPLPTNSLTVPPPAATAPVKEVPPDAVVLTIGDEKITRAQFEMIMSTLPDQQKAQVNSPAGKKKLAESLAELKALAQESRARKMDQSPRIQTQIKLQAEQVLAQNMFQELANNTKPDDAALHAYYDAHKPEYEQISAKHILIRYQGSQVPVRTGQKDLSDAEALAKATEIRAKIVAGAKFDDLAKTESDDTGNAPRGGDLGSFGKGQMVPQFDQAAFAAEIGKVTEPVRTQFGYHLILVESHVNKTFDQVKPEIETKMKPDMGQKALADLKAKKNIVYDEAFFGK
jgi:peptidyl-prolyl cis-trans isomerase C